MSVLSIWTRVIQMPSVRTRSVPLSVRVKTDLPETGTTVQVGIEKLFILQMPIGISHFLCVGDEAHKREIDPDSETQRGPNVQNVGISGVTKDAHIFSSYLLIIF